MTLTNEARREDLWNQLRELIALRKMTTDEAMLATFAKMERDIRTEIEKLN